MLLGLSAGLISAVCFGLASVAQADAVRRLPASALGLGAFMKAGLTNLRLMGVIGAYLLGFVLHAVAIWELPLYLAQAAIAMSLPITALASRRLGEAVRTRQWVALGAVVAGLWLLAVSAGPPGEVLASWSFVGPLAASLLALVAASRLTSDPPLLGALGGLAFAGSAIGVRGVGWPLEPATLVAAACVPAFGFLGFWLYSAALTERAVSDSTAPLIVGQTAGPAVIGLAFLGDGLRSGWWPALAAGLVLSMAGALVVARSGEPEKISL